ncbi:DUF4397 domain-containing protein [Ornithinimicrobium sp. Arc0846-15]|nr:DUF4397 domain-containing protein [Ornithinimicrobium laminariae]
MTSLNWTPTRTVAIAAGATALIGGAVLPAQAAEDESIVYIVQGLPGESVDISIDGEEVATGVATTDVVGPFTVEAGTSEIVFSDGDTEIAANSVETEADSNSDLVFHLPSDADGDPVVTAFNNDLSAVPADKASLTVAHTAAVPPADVLVNGDILFANIANGESLNLVVPVDTYEVEIVPTGETEPVILGPLDFEVTGGALNRVFAVGDPEAQTMNVAVHVIEVDESGSEAPTVVNTGTGGFFGVLNSVNSFFSSVLR